MFRIISKIVCTLWPAFLFLWITGAVYLHNHTKDFKEVASDDQSKFLPPDADSNLAKKLLAKGFPDEDASCSAVIVLSSEKEFNEEDFAYVESLSDWLQSDKAPKEIIKVTSIKTEPYIKERLISGDKKAVITKIDLSTIFVSPKTKEAIDAISHHLFFRPSHLRLALTGDATLGRDYTAATNDSLNKTTACTLLFLLFILIVIYRSPIAPIIPLLTIGTAFTVSISIVSYLGEKYFQIPLMVEIFLIVVLFGAGTDYCFFLISRYREELGKGIRHRQAVENALAAVGEAIAASAWTEIIGLGLMIFATFGAFKNIGPMVALGLVVAFLSSITFTPALIMIFGPLVIWPASREQLDVTKKSKGIWVGIAKLVTRFPGIILLLVLLGCAPLVNIGWRTKPSFDLTSELPAYSDTKQGIEELKKHFKESEVMPIKVVFRSSEELWSPAAIDAIYKLTAKLSQQNYITEVRSATSPLGRKATGIERALLEKRLEEYVKGADEILAGFTKLESGLNLSYEGVEKYRSALKEKSLEKILIFDKPGAKSYEEAAGRLEELSTGLKSMTSGVVDLKLGVTEIKKRLQQLSDNKELSFISDHLILSKTEIEQYPDLKKGMQKYIGEGGHIGKLEVHITYEPYSIEALNSVEKLKQLLREYSPYCGIHIEEGFHLIGASPIINDIRLVTRRDFKLIKVLTIAAIFIILLMMLRKVISPLYLTATMLLSYFVTMGVTFLVFNKFEGIKSLDWKVEFFMFVLLIAIGIDYNIFLMSRVKEEEARHDTFNAVQRAVAFTGGPISSCGIIMAGTFASLMTSSLSVMVQLGFAISFGMLFDTFIIRPVVVPAIAVLIDRFKVNFRYERHNQK